MRNPRIIELAELLGRSIGSVSYKLSNFARLDPALRERGIRGNEHGARGEEEVWNAFTDDPETLAFESERLTAELLGRTIEDVSGIETRDLPLAGVDREATVRVRVNQSFFRRRIISLYEYRCCITGLEVIELLVASHIIPWARDAINRLNPQNGLCLNSLHDRAFDRGLMWIDSEYTVHFSSRLLDDRANTASAWLTHFEGQRLKLPRRFVPDRAFLSQHAEQCER